MHQDKVRNCSVLIYLISLYLFFYLFDNLLFYPKIQVQKKTNERSLNERFRIVQPILIVHIYERFRTNKYSERFERSVFSNHLFKNYRFVRKDGKWTIDLKNERNPLFLKELQIIFFPSHNLSSFPLCPLAQIFVCLSCDFLHFQNFFIDFDGYYIDRTDEGQPRPKYIFNKCGTNIYFVTLLLYKGLVHHHHQILIHNPEFPG